MTGIRCSGDGRRVGAAAARCRSALEKIIEYTAQQRLIPRRFTVDELFDDTTRKMV